MVECPLRFARFDVTTARLLFGPGFDRLSIPGMDMLGPGAMEAIKRTGELLTDVETEDVPTMSAEGRGHDPRQALTGQLNDLRETMMANRPSRVGKAMWRTAMGIHRTLYRWTGGRLGGTMRRRGAEAGRILLLTTTGRRSGRPWTNPLMYMGAGGELMIVALQRRLRQPPSLVPEPQGPSLGDRADRADETVDAWQVAEGDERDRLWAELVRRYPGYGKYQTKTTRQIPIVLLASEER